MDPESGGNQVQKDRDSSNATRGRKDHQRENRPRGRIANRQNLRKRNSRTSDSRQRLGESETHPKGPSGQAPRLSRPSLFLLHAVAADAATSDRLKANATPCDIRTTCNLYLWIFGLSTSPKLLNKSAVRFGVKNKHCRFYCHRQCLFSLSLVGARGFEPPTS